MRANAGQSRPKREGARSSTGRGGASIRRATHIGIFSDSKAVAISANGGDTYKLLNTNFPFRGERIGLSIRKSGCAVLAIRGNVEAPYSCRQSQNVIWKDCLSLVVLCYGPARSFFCLCVFCGLCLLQLLFFRIFVLRVGYLSCHACRVRACVTHR